MAASVLSVFHHTVRRGACSYFLERASAKLGGEWLRHMALGPDLISDPAGLEVRPLEGLQVIT